MRRPPIRDYALIGDTRTAALVSSKGSIDWMCVPRFDSDPVFGRLLDQDAGGYFSVGVEAPLETSRRYRDGSAVLATTWRTASGEAMLTDGMVAGTSGTLLPQLLLVRRLQCLEGRVVARIAFDPRPGLPGRPPRRDMRGDILVCTWGSLALSLRTSPQLELRPGREATMVLDQGSTLTLALAVSDRGPLVFVDPESASHRLETTDAWWRAWAEDIRYEGPHRDAVVRSLVTLRLLTYSPSGAPVAAPTTSLPEAVGGVRNWDYRLSWPRDAAIGLAAFLAVGKLEEAHSFMHWLLHAARLTRPRIEVLYTIYGRPGPKELEVSELSGYEKSLPVRIGNAASKQHQLDVYGWVLDAAWLLVHSGGTLHGETWRMLAGAADFVAGSWRLPDAGIWEVRGDPAHYVHSKLMGWVALDRALRIARTHAVRSSRRARWVMQRKALEVDVKELGFDPDRGSYTWSYGSEHLDASLLILPVIDFEDEHSARTLGTVLAVRRELSPGGRLLYRYPPGVDGLPGTEGAFLPCSFWLVQALARIGRYAEALALFDDLLGYSSDLGLFPEEIDPPTGEHLGNFPQALTHATLVQAALALQAASPATGKAPEESRTRRAPRGPHPESPARS